MGYLKAIIITLVTIQAVVPAFAAPLKVGVIIPLTGYMSGNARFGKNGIEFALKNNELSQKLEVQFEDYGSEPVRAIASYKKLAELDKVHAFLIFGTPAAMALNPMMEHDKNVQLAIASAERLTKEGGFAFRLVNSAESEAEYIAKHFGIYDRPESSAVVYVEDDFGESYLRGIRSSLGEEKATKLTVYSFMSKETDFRSAIMQLRSKKPSTVFLAAFAPPVGMFLRQARELNLQAKFICSLACYNPDLFALAQGAEEGLTVTSPAQAENPELVAEYRRQFNEEPNFISLGFYDAVMMLSEVAGDCVSTPEVGTCLRDSLRRAKGFKTSRGQLLFDEKGEMQFNLMSYVATNGKFVQQ